MQQNHSAMLLNQDGILLELDILTGLLMFSGVSDEFARSEWMPLIDLSGLWMEEKKTGLWMEVSTYIDTCLSHISLLAIMDIWV